MSAQRAVVILAGGSGERFWPLSKPGRPKQLLHLTDPKMTMLEEAVHRVLSIVDKDMIFISTSRELADPIERAKLVDDGNVLAEPARRNTLGAMVWLSAILDFRGLGDASVAVLTSDHKIGDVEVFQKELSLALDTAELEESLVTLGIKPTRPATGFGYIETDVSSSETLVFPVKSFHEKPSLESAQSFLKSPDFFWNSGMLFLTLRSFRQTLKKCQPNVFEAYRKIVNAFHRSDELAAIKAFESIPNMSFEFAVLEIADKVSMIRANFAWDDVGSWDALERSFASDSGGNIVQGCAAILESSGCIIVNEVDTAVVGILGLTDCIVVNTNEGVLVCPKALAQRVREVSAASLMSLAAHLGPM